MEARSSAVPAALTAALADRYRIDRELGRGGMATVDSANDLKDDREVLIVAAAAMIDAERRWNPASATGIGRLS